MVRRQPSKLIFAGSNPAARSPKTRQGLFVYIFTSTIEVLYSNPAARSPKIRLFISVSIKPPQWTLCTPIVGHKKFLASKNTSQKHFIFLDSYSNNNLVIFIYLYFNAARIITVCIVPDFETGCSACTGYRTGVSMSFCLTSSSPFNMVATNPNL